MDAISRLNPFPPHKQPSFKREVCAGAVHLLLCLLALVLHVIYNCQPLAAGGGGGRVAVARLYLDRSDSHLKKICKWLPPWSGV